MAWFSKEKKPRETVEQKTVTPIPEGSWLKYEEYRQIIYRKEIEQNFSDCTKSGYQYRISAQERLEMLFDDRRFREFATDIRSSVPLKFRDTKRYRDRLKVYEQRVGTGDAVRCAEGKLDGITVVVCAMEYNFMGGS